MENNNNERSSTPTHAGEENNINNTQDYTEPNVLGAAPCSAFGDFVTKVFTYFETGDKNVFNDPKEDQ